MGGRLIYTVRVAREERVEIPALNGSTGLRIRANADHVPRSGVPVLRD